MKVKRLKLNNIGIHKELDVEFGDFTTISGANAEGKTTIDNALIEAIEGSDIPLLSNGEETGSIEVHYDNEISVKIPFRKSGKASPEIRQGNFKLDKTPRTQLKEWHNDARIRAIDFFSGKGAELKKYQTDTIMSILKIRLDESEIKEITDGELPLPDFFGAEHPLAYIKRLVNEKDGYYYTMRAKNNEGVQTIAHSNGTLYQKVAESLEVAKIDPAFFEPSEYRTLSVTEKVKELKEKQDINTAIDKAKIFLDGFDAYMEKESKSWDDAIAKKRLEYEQKHTAKKHTLELEIKELEKQLERKRSELNAINNGIDSEIEKLLAPIKSEKKSRIDAMNKEREANVKYTVEHPDKFDTEALSKEIDEIQAVKEILPTYDTWVKGAKEYEDMKSRSEQLSEIIERLRKLPSDILKREKLPIEGLSMNEDGEFVVLNSHGIPVLLSQLSGFEKLRLSLDISIARLGEIKMLIIPQWSEIDPENKEKIKSYLKSKGVQGVAIEVGFGKLNIVRE